MLALLPAILPVGLIISIGVIAGLTLPLERQTLAQLTLYVLAPALILDSLFHTTVSFDNAVGLLLGFAITSLAIYLIVWGLSAILNLSSSLQTSLVATSLFPNNGNMGLPLIAFALGETGLDLAIIYMLASSILMFGFGPAILKGGGVSSGLSLTFKLPLFWAMLAGVGLRFLLDELPFNFDEGIELLGKASIPVALIILGMQLATTRFDIGIYEAVAAIMRLLVAPSIAFLVGTILGLEGIGLQVLVLQSAMPTAVNTFVIATEFGGDASWIARAIVLSTLTSFFTIPLVLWLSTST